MGESDRVQGNRTAEGPGAGRDQDGDSKAEVALAGGGRRSLADGADRCVGGGGMRVKTPNGTIVLENVPEDAVVEIDGEKITVTPACR